MPIYEYECGACGAVHDVLHKVSDKPPRKCPSCGALKLKRLISAPRFRLKGEGWYETDFKTGDKRNLADSGDGGAADDGGANKASSGDDASKSTSKDKGDSKPAKKEASSGKKKSTGKIKSGGDTA